MNQNGCTDTTACEIVDNIGLSSLANSIVSTHPNPTSGEVSLSTPEIIKTVIVYSATGQLIFEENVDNKDFFFSLLDEPKGIYLVTINTDSGSITRRIVKQ